MQKWQIVDKNRVQNLQRRLSAASQLIQGLGSERIRWTADLEVQGAVKERLVGDCLLCAAFVSYSGPFNHEYRLEMVYDDWHKIIESGGIKVTPEFKLQSLLTSDVEIAAWNGFGLPTDELSVQNGILVSRSSRYPLCVDPQMQAVVFLDSDRTGSLTVLLNTVIRILFSDKHSKCVRSTKIVSTNIYWAGSQPLGLVFIIFGSSSLTLI